MHCSGPSSVSSARDHGLPGNVVVQPPRRHGDDVRRRAGVDLGAVVRLRFDAGVYGGVHLAHTDQEGHRKRRGSRGSRPVGLDAPDYRNVVVRRYCHLKQWRGLATRYDKHAVNYAPP